MRPAYESCMGCCHAGVFYVNNNAPPCHVPPTLMQNISLLAPIYALFGRISLYFFLLPPPPQWCYSCTLCASRVLALLVIIFGLECARVIILSKGSFVWSRRTVCSTGARNYSKIPVHIFTLPAGMLMEVAVFWPFVGCGVAVIKCENSGPIDPCVGRFAYA